MALKPTPRAVHVWSWPVLILYTWRHITAHADLGAMSGTAFPNALHTAALTKGAGITPRGMFVNDVDGEAAKMRWRFTNHPI